ncbi:MAG: hypothetical protein LGR52_11180 [Candidatus Thiosymbion ectosymbiont of Robbea hypermnestra]|nr:hypothetical protein [Candidatus Thiosymbion ectosymbiont of Robbea hypermnestra]
MVPNTAVIIQRLDSSPWIRRDNEAQKIIREAAPDELRYLDVGGVLRLYDALTGSPGVYSARDAAAMRALKAHTQFQPVLKTPDFGVDLVKKARPDSPIIQSQLTPDLVTRIYAAEKKRLSLLERAGIDGATIGRGQVGQSAYDDVKKRFKITLEAYLTRVVISEMLQNAPRRPLMNVLNFNTHKVVIPQNYGTILSYPPAEDFVVAAYLAIRITDAATRGGPSRSAKDATRFAVALYHGMGAMVMAAQAAVKDGTNWAPVEAELLRQGHRDEVAYVHEVVK